MQEQPNKSWSGRFRELLNRTFEQWQRRFAFEVVLLGLIASFPSLAGAEPMQQTASAAKCSQPAIDRLEKESSHVRRWLQLQAFHHRYLTCKVDDAEVSTGVGDSVVHMLIYRWGSLAAANRLFMANPAFKHFALAGLNVTDATGDLDRIDNLAAEHCAPNLHKLCRDIRASIADNK